MCMENNIPGMVKYDAQLICMKVSSKLHITGDNVGKPIITRGRNRAGIVAGCLYIACRKNRKYTRSAREIADYSNIDEADVNRGVAAIQSILKDDPIIRDIGTSRVTDFIKRKCDELRIRNIHATRAMLIGNNIERLGIASNHTTYALAAAAILLMADIDGLTDITKKILSEHFSKLTDVTIGKTYNQIQNLREILVNDIVTAEIIRRVNIKRKRRTISREVAQKMRDFGVNTSKYIIEGEEDKFVETDDDSNYVDSDNSNNIGDIINNNDEFDITIDDICELILEIQKEMNDIKNQSITNDAKMELLEKRAMIVQFVKEYPETLDQKGVDIDFFLNELCPTKEDRDEILRLCEDEKTLDLFDQDSNKQENLSINKKSSKNPIKYEPKTYSKTSINSKSQTQRSGTKKKTKTVSRNS